VRRSNQICRNQLNKSQRDITVKFQAHSAYLKSNIC
jgi:hypothetical protein